jgi:hypothetical protein
VTPVLRAGGVPVHLDVDVTGGARLTLDVGDAGDGVGHDNGDWGGLQLTGCSGSGVSPNALSTSARVEAPDPARRRSPA